MRLRLLLLWIAALGLSHAAAQAPAHTIKLLTKVSKKGVLLRWAPSDFATWQVGNKYGYIIERYDLKEDGTIGSIVPKRLSAIPVKPLPDEKMQTLAADIKEVAMIRELIYQSGESNTKLTGPAALLQQKQDADTRFGMALLICDLTPQVAGAAGLFWKDSTAVPGARYIYKVMVTSSRPTKMTIEPAIAVVDVKEPKPLQPFTDVTAEFGNKKVTLIWPILLHKGVYNAYIVERSSDGNTFTSVTDLPYIPMTEASMMREAYYVDSLAANDIPYHYRVKGLTPFGEEGPPSNVVSGAGKDDLSGLVVLREVKSDGKGSASLRWEFPAEWEQKIKGFVVSRAPKAEGPYTDVAAKALTEKSREATDNTNVSVYYRIKAVDAAGNEITHSQPYFFHVEDNTPPAIPTGLTGSSDKNGIVTLTWNNNTDTDLLGYRVFSSNDLKHEFVEVSTVILPTTAYSDTINIQVLNENIYYVVLAVDNNFNTSAYSKPLTVARPDVIPPAAPLFTKVEKKDRTVTLEWTNSVSSDVASSTLYRTMINDTARTNLLTWRPGSKQPVSFTDSNVPSGRRYKYLLNVYDDGGNVATAISREINLEADVRESVTELKAIIDREQKNITLQWNYPAHVKKCLLYRKKNDESFTLYQSLDGTLQQFIDKQVTANNTYSYKIQLVLETNVRTELSKSLKVPF